MIIKIISYKEILIEKLIKCNINFELINDDTIKIEHKDYNKIKKINYISKIKIIKEKSGLKQHIKKYLIDYIFLIIILIILFIISNMIFKIEIKVANKKDRIYINTVLNKYNIKKYHFKKSIKELNTISNNIILSNKNIEWIRIKKVGIKYIVNVEMRITNEDENKNEYCNIISNKDAIINKIIVYEGENLVEKGQKVKKGDILISGDIKYNDEIKKQVCASGIVLGNTWYEVETSILYIYKEKKFTNKYHINFSFNNKKIFKTKYTFYEEKTIFKLFNLKIIREKELEYKEVKYNYEELKEKIINESINKLNVKLKNIVIKDYIIMNEENTTDYLKLKIFFSLIEDITN